MPELFAAQARRTPDALAITWGATALSFGELAGRAFQLAHHLRGLGVTPRVEQPVAMCLRPEPEMVVAMVGILTAGGVYVPLDPSHPPQRLGHVLADAARAGGRRIPVVTRKAFLGALPDDVRLVLIEHAAAWRGLPRQPPRPAVSADSLANVIYTSGSTGRPKGVAISHRTWPPSCFGVRSC